MSVQLKTMAMKARVANFIRKSIYKKRLEDLKDKEKIELFDKIFTMTREMHWELRSYKHKRKDAARLYAERVARGYKFKKRTSLKEYQASQKVPA